MNKEQYREYRRNQRICYCEDNGYPYEREKYFNRIPLHREQLIWISRGTNVITIWKWLNDPKKIYPLTPEMRRSQLRSFIKRNLRGSKIRHYSHDK